MTTLIVTSILCLLIGSVAGFCAAALLHQAPHGDDRNNENPGARHRR